MSLPYNLVYSPLLRAVIPVNTCDTATITWRVGKFREVSTCKMLLRPTKLAVLRICKP